MSFAPLAEGAIRLKNPRISDRDAERQTRAARELLTRLARQPGVILADEVGMGKTFVALAVAASILIDRENAGPVVVMTPPSLRDKWPKDWTVFLTHCLPEYRERFRARTAESGVELLRLLDDPVERRAHVIFLTHGALHRAVGDGFAKLAVVKRAFKGRSSLGEQRRNFGRFAGRILRMEWVERWAPGLLANLLERSCEDWLRAIHRADDRFKKEVPDDPVPAALAGALEEMDGHDFDAVVEALRNVPLRESAYLDERLKEARDALSGEMEAVWQQALRRVKFHSPLLVLDEAHHVKNPETKLASLFVREEFDKESNFLSSGGPLADKFDRMLFLTATPFQLGHGELIRVLERFEGIDWQGPRPPAITKEEFKAEIAALAQKLDDAQGAALRLDRAWGRLGAEHVGSDAPSEAEIETWWQEASGAEGEGILAQVVQQVSYTREAMKKAEQALGPWVLRHVRPAMLTDGSDLPRREVHTGASIISDDAGSAGLEITPQTLLPFLLAGRAQGLLAASTKGRAFFADGLASSFEAYLETRSGQLAVDEDADSGEAVQSAELQWYLGHLDKALPKDSRDARSAHPKIQATVERGIKLWKAGEKVLIFCHYRATGRALRQHISARLHQEILALGAKKLAGRSPREVESTLDELDELGEQFFKDEKLRASISSALEAIVTKFTFSLAEREQVVEVVRRFLRTPSFLVRYFPLEVSDTAAGMAQALQARQGGESLRERIESFCRFLSERCTADERAEFLNALLKVQTGTQFGKEVRAVFDPAEGSSDETAMLLPNVRLANGEVRHETRRTLLLTFNTPLFPEILIASSVLAEGVDLHLHCRYVIHHDLCWNPSTLEQRSGRVDRIGCLAERIRQSINLYLPYVAATQDEKMFRVVRDRERWFQIVMGEKYEVDEAATERRAARIPLPETLRSELALKLHT